MPQFLNSDQESALKQAHREIKIKKLADRIKAVLLLNQGFTSAQVSRMLLLDEGTINRYMRQYRERSLAGLLEYRYGGRDGLLLPVQERELKVHLDTHLYSSAKEIIRYVKLAYHTKYSLAGMTHLLHRLGFVYKQTKLVPGKADTVKQQVFLDSYRQLQKEAESMNHIYFIDATHPVHNTRPGNGWILKGKAKYVRANTGRDRLNLNGALNAVTHKTVVLSEPAINFEASIKLAQKLLAIHPRGKIHLILDQASYYRSRLFAAFVKKHRRIRLHFLPPYSPNLNLIERLWGFMHRKILYNHYYEKFSQFEFAVLNFFKHLHRYRKELDSLLTDSFQTLPALQLQT